MRCGGSPSRRFNTRSYDRNNAACRACVLGAFRYAECNRTGGTVNNTTSATYSYDQANRLTTRTGAAPTATTATEPECPEVVGSSGDVRECSGDSSIFLFELVVDGVEGEAAGVEAAQGGRPSPQHARPRRVVGHGRAR